MKQLNIFENRTQQCILKPNNCTLTIKIELIHLAKKKNRANSTIVITINLIQSNSTYASKIKNWAIKR